MSSFIHCQVHSEYSVSHGLMRVKQLIACAQSQHMPAVALTDTMNMFAVLKFYQQALKAGIKPLIGCELMVHDAGSSPYRMIVLCQSMQGYQSLSELLSRAYESHWHEQVGPCVDGAWLDDGQLEGVLVILPGVHSRCAHLLAQDSTRHLASEQLKRWQDLFPEALYMGIKRVGHPQEAALNRPLIDLADQAQVPLLAINDVHFAHESDHRAHEARVCISRGEILSDPKRRSDFTPQQCFASKEVMQTRFSDLPDALANTLVVAQRCNVQLDVGQVYLPDFPVAEGQSLEIVFKQAAQEGLELRLQEEAIPAEQHQPYLDRLDHEIQTIVHMGFEGYFLIVADFIRWSKAQCIPVGPGRGSGAGSLVAFALGITDVDPLHHDLLFERFLNPERVSMPDFDVDFCMDGRDRVIDYVVQRYGRDRVSQIITFGSMAAKAVVRDVGRILQHPYGYVDKLAKLIPLDLGMTLTQAMEQEDELKRRYDQEDDVRELFDLALKLEGTTRNVGKHAGGVVVAPRALPSFVPMYFESPGQGAVTQLDKDDIEAIGLVKFDFLGLRTLTIINNAVNMARRYDEQVPEHMHLLPLDDPKTYALLRSGATACVFQLESRGMRDLILRLKPDSFDDIVALVALFRPGPLQSGMVDDYVDRKHGLAPVVYPHPWLEPILKPTYGVILYQEQVMQIAQVLAGYTLGGADLLRRAMGKKKPEEMAKQRSIFLAGSKQQGIDPEVASGIFDLMEKFAGYGFNKSHSVAYALLSYQTAWLKTHHPAAFMAAVLSADMDTTDKMLSLMQECRSLGLDVLPPDVQTSAYRFEYVDRTSIRYGLGAIKGIGQGVVDTLVQSREQSGPFADFFDFCERASDGKLNKRVLESFIRSGALDAFGDRAALLASSERALGQADQHRRQAQSGQNDLFAQLGSTPQAAMKQVLADVPNMASDERLRGEKDVLGFYMSGHPMAAHREELTAYGVSPMSALSGLQGKQVTVAGYIVQAKHMSNKAGKRFAFVTLEDETGRVDLAFFSDIYQDFREHTQADATTLLVQGECGVDDFTGSYRIRVDQLLSWSDLRAHKTRLLRIRPVGEISVAWLDRLRVLLALAPKGGTQVELMYDLHETGLSVTQALGQAWHIQVTDALIEALDAWEEAAYSLHQR